MHQEPNQNQLTRSNEIEWHPLDEPGVTGVWVKSLRFDNSTLRSPTILLKFDPGATYPVHSHPGGEEIFVLSGDIKLGKDHLQAGDFLYTAPHNIHAVRSVGGCVVMVSVPTAVEILRNSSSSTSPSNPKA